MAIDPDPDALGDKPGGWKRQPLAMWMFLALGAGRIVLTGIGLVLFRPRK